MSNEAPEKFAFKAQEQEILNLMIRSVYSQKDVFLRELLSNASDALDKRRLLTLSQPDADSDAPYTIEVSIDEAQKTLNIKDHGVGMSKEEAIQFLGTIAQSGTKDFVHPSSDGSMIGQFGIGFYSAFIVASEVHVYTRRFDTSGPESGVHWSSKGVSDFDVQSCHLDAIGTQVILHISEENKEFLEFHHIVDIAKRYAAHLPFHVMIRSAERSEVINDAKVIWTQKPSDVSQEDYVQFYQTSTHDSIGQPLCHMHAHLESTKSDYTILLYVPDRLPFQWMNQEPEGLKLYVKRVFIMDSKEQILPRYLRFIRGLVDAKDISLNVSREMLQNDPIIRSISEGVKRKALAMLSQLAQEQPENYGKFWKLFGSVLKEGLIEDASYRDKILPLIRCYSTHDASIEATVSLKDYKNRMLAQQKKIYYLIGENLSVARQSPYLEAFKKSGHEVLLLCDRVDDWWVHYVTAYEDVPLESVTQAECPETEQGSIISEPSSQDDVLLSRIQTALEERVSQVSWSKRLSESLSCLGKQDMQPHMQRWMKEMGHAMPETKPSLELNMTHPLMKKIMHESDASKFQAWCDVLLDQAILAESGKLEDPMNFLKKMHELLV